jgi:DNA-binding GntR family transcriptional regulator
VTQLRLNRSTGVEETDLSQGAENPDSDFRKRLLPHPFREQNPVREALRILANEGLVDLIQIRGRDSSPSLDEVRVSYEVREHLEVIAAAKAARNITPVQLCLLEEAIDEEEGIFVSRDLERYLEVNIRFHRIIAEASRNRTLSEYVANILARTYVYMVFFESFFDFDTNPSLDEHREIVKALRQRDESLTVDR